MKRVSVGAIFGLLPFLLSGCAVGDKMMSISVIYAVTTVCSFLLLCGYCFMIRKKESWFLLLFSSVCVVNVGYLMLSLSASLSYALMANRVAYLGSVFLPISMLMIILKVCDFRYRKWLAVFLLCIATVVFLIAASPGYSDIYYRTVSFERVGGVAVLQKEYGPWHCVYLFYLMAMFALMIGAIVYACVKKKIDSPNHALILATATLVNIGVWLLEQLVKIDFELLSISYIISELFLLGIYAMMQEIDLRSNRSEAHTNEVPAAETEEASLLQEQCAYLQAHLASLTPTEHTIYELYLQGKGTKDVMQELNIKENTLKYHNKNIYSKLGVRSRKQLLSIANAAKEA